MKITDVTPIVVGNPWKNWVFVKVETDEGICGLGEATVGLNTLPAESAVREIRHLCIGWDPRDIHALWDHLYKSMYLAEGQIQRAAMAGIEIACWDILGKSLGVPVYQLLGGKCRDGGIRAYANGWYRGPRDPAFFAERAQAVVEMGYTALKFDPFGRAHRTLPKEEERRSFALIEAVKSAIGDSADIIIEGHDRFTVSTAIRIGKRLEDYEPLWFEAPILSTDIDGLVEVAEAIPVPIGVGERFQTLGQFAKLLAHRRIDVVTPEMIDMGGLWPTREVASIAGAHQALVAIHNARGPIATAVNCHIDVTLPNFLIQETFEDFNEDWTRELILGAPKVHRGYLHVSDAPGFGIELNEALAAKHPYSPRYFLRLFEEGWERRLEGNGVDVT